MTSQKPLIGQRMTKVVHILESIGMFVCIGYTLVCWVADLGRIGNMHPGVRYQLLFPAGVVSTLLGFVLEIFSYRRRPVLARCTLAACVLWGVWALLPRL